MNRRKFLQWGSLASASLALGCQSPSLPRPSTIPWNDLASGLDGEVVRPGSGLQLLGLQLAGQLAGLGRRRAAEPPNGRGVCLRRCRGGSASRNSSSMPTVRVGTIERMPHLPGLAEWRLSLMSGARAQPTGDVRHRQWERGIPPAEPQAPRRDLEHLEFAMTLAPVAK
jgi:hypothetical protein